MTPGSPRVGRLFVGDAFWRLGSVILCQTKDARSCLGGLSVESSLQYHKLKAQSFGLSLFCYSTGLVESDMFFGVSLSSCVLSCRDCVVCGITKRS